MTTRPGSETTTLKVGDKVRCQREEPAKGTWKNYDGREGTVVSINNQTFPDGTTYVEIGLWFGKVSETRDLRRTKAQSWFRNDELIPID